MKHYRFVSDLLCAVVAVGMAVFCCAGSADAVQLHSQRGRHHHLKGLGSTMCTGRHKTRHVLGSIGGSGSRLHRYVAARRRAHRLAAHTRSAYPADFFMRSAPPSDGPLINAEAIPSMQNAFQTGAASHYTPDELAQAGVFVDSHPLIGGIFNRREQVKYVILHSTETARPADAPRVIHSWNRGMRHPGAQYIVDRDGTIYQTVDPDYGTVHVDVFRTTAGVNNDNSIGIEMVRAGEQQYTPTQLESVTRLVAYLQGRFNVPDEHVLGHGEVQPSDRRDPVGFDWMAFNGDKNALKLHAAVVVKHHARSAVISDDAMKTDSDATAAHVEADRKRILMDVDDAPVTTVMSTHHR